jgi:Zn finger protein HypA/HybF involved in hydrogenase expression
MLFPMLIVMGIFYGVFESGDTSTFFKIERSTIQREALPESKCIKIDTWYQDDWGDWIDDPAEPAALKSGLQYFYEKTGVQPYLWIMGEEGKDYMSEGSVEELADKKYKELFGNDEGHLLVVFREYPNASSNYIVTATPGYDAETQVMDEQAREILLDYIDYYYTNEDLNEGQFFQRAFTKAADRIMIKQLSNKQLVTIVAVVAVVVIGIIIVASIIRKKKGAVAKQKAAQAKAEADRKKAEAAQKKTEFDQQKYNDQLETQYVAVECPNCGATGNKIRKATVGYCPYCGTAIKVDQDGQVKIINRDDPDNT